MTASGTPVREVPPATACPRCGAELRPDQDWCLSCGLAVTTHVAGAPGWRAPVAIVAAVLALAAAGLVVAFLELSDDAERDVAQAPAPTATAEPAPPPEATPAPGAEAGPTGATGPAPGEEPDTPEPTPDPAAGGIGTWPEGRTAYTVILASETSRESAEQKARQFQASGSPIGILESGDFESLRPGFHVVFSGQYDEPAEAEAAAEGLRSSSPDAYVRRIAPS